LNYFLKFKNFQTLKWAFYYTIFTTAFRPL